MIVFWNVVVMLAQWVFVLGLIPSLLSAEKPILSSAVPFALALWANSLALCMLGLWAGGLTCSLAALGWTVLAIQRYRINKRLQPLWYLQLQLPKRLEQILMMD